MRPVRGRGWTAICAGTRSMQFVSMSRQAGFSSPVATGGPRSASRRSPASIALGHRPGRSPLSIMGSAGGWLLSQGVTARSRQPLSRGFVPAPTRRVAPGRAGPSRETGRCAPSTISPGHRCPVLRDRVASLRGKYIPQPQVEALLSLYRRHVTRGHPIGAHHVGSKTWSSLCRGIACTVAAVYRWGTGIGPLGGQGSRIRPEVGWIRVASARSARRVSFECCIANA
jgi:hypothetical protein